MRTLAVETLGILERYEKTKEDILWIGGADFTIPKDLFWKLANTYYSNNLGSPRVAQDLIIRGKDWWLEREVHDGGEWWNFKSLPKKPPIMRMITALTKDQAHIDYGWCSLSTFNPFLEEEVEDF